MEIIHREIVASRRCAKIDIVCMGCLHYGARGCDEAAIDFWIKRILKEPDTYCILGGDLIDAIQEKDKRYAAEECSPLTYGHCPCCKRGGTIIDRESIHFQNKFRPLAEASKILWMHEGNHESKIYLQFGGPDLVRQWAYNLNVPYAGYQALSYLSIKLPHGKDNKSGGCGVRFFTTHGHGTAKTSGAAINKIKGYLSVYAVDVALAWHWHQRVTDGGRRRLGLSRPHKGTVRLRTFDRIGAACGTFLNSHLEDVTGYGERAGYDPVIPGPVVIHIKPETGNNGNETVRIWASTAVVERANEES